MTVAYSNGVRYGGRNCIDVNLSRHMANNTGGDVLP